MKKVEFNNTDLEIRKIFFLGKKKKHSPKRIELGKLKLEIEKYEFGERFFNWIYF